MQTMQRCACELLPDGWQSLAPWIAFRHFQNDSASRGSVQPFRILATGLLRDVVSKRSRAGSRITLLVTLGPLLLELGLICSFKSSIVGWAPSCERRLALITVAAKIPVRAADRYCWIL